MGYDPKWVIEGTLAKSSRPGHRSTDVPISVVDSWIEKALSMEIKSIICFLTEDQLAYYARIPSGLLGHYRNFGFEILHLPEEDYLNPPLSEGNLRGANLREPASSTSYTEPRNFAKLRARTDSQPV